MTEIFAGINGHRLTSVKLTVANVGPWVADVVFEAAPDVSGKVKLTIGTLELTGTVDPSHNGTFGLQRKARIIAGANGWGSKVVAWNYANDAGVKALTVAQDAARLVGETLGSFVPTKERVGIAYVRQAGLASRVLEDALNGAPWWVDYDGTTKAGPRKATALDAKAYEVLAYDPAAKVATLAVDDPGAVRIGSILSERLDAPATVRELELTVNANELRITAWCGGSETGLGRLPGLMRAIVERATDSRLYGKYAYRVVRMDGDRVQCQAVSKAAGLPDVLPVSMVPGMAGAHAQLTPGAGIYLEFVAGDRTQPIITGFAGKDGTGFVPISLGICEGPAPAPAAARVGDAVQVTLPPGPFSGTLNGVTPISGTITWAPPATAQGTITAGSAKVRIG
jgi:hypothetical protein